jgi:alkanesulfonate monooxygenase SsuD/methylene tetrahydromethanopterin reductase-like flavin-dependent oxidoreductase (luciferase family)
MRFGLFIPQGWRMDLVGIDPDKHWAVMRELATYADNSARDSLWVYDHFHTVPVPTGEATHEAWSLMAAYAATADIVSGGRIQMGIGGGWYEHEWRAYGYGFPSAGVRLARLDEGVQIMRDAWRDGKVSFDGEHYLRGVARDLGGRRARSAGCVRPRARAARNVWQFPAAVRQGIDSGRNHAHARVTRCSGPQRSA